MPRVKLAAERYAKEDFRKEIEHKMIDAGIRSWADLGREIGVDDRTIYRRRDEPEKFKAGELALLIKLLHLDPAAVLKFLGYQGKEIPT